MSLYIASLNSGSNGNCYYIGNGSEAVLIDAGISCRETEKRLKQLELPADRIKGIFISHEHSDHITGVPGFSKKHQVPVYITQGTLQYANIPVEAHLVQSFRAFEAVGIGGLTVTAFPKFHDANDPHSFVVSYGDVCVAIITDIGKACEHVIHHFKKCHAVFLEANYCPDMLMKGTYPYHLKRRISGGNGHLSNQEALNLFLTHRGKHLTHLILCHLSKNNNKPELVEKMFVEKAGSTQIIVASRYAASEVYHITGPAYEKEITPVKRKQPVQLQLALF